MFIITNFKITDFFREHTTQADLFMLYDDGPVEDNLKFDSLHRMSEQRNSWEKAARSIKFPKPTPPRSVATSIPILSPYYFPIAYN